MFTSTGSFARHEQELKNSWVNSIWRNVRDTSPLGDLPSLYNSLHKENPDSSRLWFLSDWTVCQFYNKGLLTIRQAAALYDKSPPERRSGDNLAVLSQHRVFEWLEKKFVTMEEARGVYDQVFKGKKSEEGVSRSDDAETLRAALLRSDVPILARVLHSGGDYLNTALLLLREGLKHVNGEVNQYTGDSALHVLMNVHAMPALSEENKKTCKDVIYHVLAAGADVNVPNKRGETPLYIAVKTGQPELVELLRANGARDENATKLAFDERNGVPQYPEIRDLFAKQDITQNALLPWAVFFDYPKVTERLLQQGASIHSKYDSKTALDIAAKEGSLETLQLLLQYPDKRYEVEDRMAALFKALRKGHKKCAELLMHHVPDNSKEGDLTFQQMLFGPMQQVAQNPDRDVPQTVDTVIQLGLLHNLGLVSDITTPILRDIQKNSRDVSRLGQLIEYIIDPAAFTQKAKADNTLAPYANSNITFGVEIEGFGIEASRLMNLKGAVAGVFNGYEYTDDQSIQPDDHTQGFEIRSAIMNTPESAAVFRVMVDTLVLAGAKTNSSCGLHVHMGTFGTGLALAPLPQGEYKPVDVVMPPVSALERLQMAGGEDVQTAELVEQFQLSVIKQFALNYLQLQKTLNTTLRDGKAYTQPEIHVYTKDIPSEISEIRSADDLEELGDVINPLKSPRDERRRRTLNIQSLDKHHTVEIRHHEGSVDSEAILGWVQLLHGVMTKSIATVSQAYEQHYNPEQPYSAAQIDARLVDGDETVTDLYKQWYIGTERRNKADVEDIVDQWDRPTMRTLLDIERAKKGMSVQRRDDDFKENERSTPLADAFVKATETVYTDLVQRTQSKDVNQRTTAAEDIDRVAPFMATVMKAQPELHHRQQPAISLAQQVSLRAKLFAELIRRHDGAKGQGRE